MIMLRLKTADINKDPPIDPALHKKFIKPLTELRNCKQITSNYFPKLFDSYTLSVRYMFWVIYEGKSLSTPWHKKCFIYGA